MDSRSSSQKLFQHSWAHGTKAVNNVTPNKKRNTNACAFRKTRKKTKNKNEQKIVAHGHVYVLSIAHNDKVKLKFNKIFSGHQPHQMVEILHCFRKHLCPHHQGYEVQSPWEVHKK
jgi:hypothetical protein